MTRDLQKRFVECWPDTSTRLRYLLVRYRVPAGKREDIIQETATRLVSMWASVDPARPVWPLAKTIALNLLRDEARRVFEEIPTEIVTEREDDLDPLLMARLEWSRVVSAIGELSPQHRAALLTEVGEGHRDGSAAEKMLRMRARRRLREALKRLPALLPARLRGLELGTLFGPVGQATVPGLACLACLSLLPSIAPRASAAPETETLHAPEVSGLEVGSGGLAFSFSPAVRVARARGIASAIPDRADDRPTATTHNNAGQDNASTGGGTQAPRLPSTPSLPSKSPVDGDVAVQAAPQPEVPAPAPEVPLPESAVPVVGEVVEEAVGL